MPTQLFSGGKIDKLKLNLRQKLFCHHYLTDFNATNAIKKAGYSAKTASEAGCLMLKNPKVKSYIDSIKEELTDKADVKTLDVINEYKKVAFSNLQDYLKDGNTISDLSKLPRGIVAAVDTIQCKVGKDGTEEIKIKLHNKLTALDALSRHLGIFERDNLQAAQKQLVVIDYGNIDDSKRTV